MKQNEPHKGVPGAHCLERAADLLKQLSFHKNKVGGENLGLRFS